MSETENAASGSNPVATTSPEDVGLCEHCVSGARLSGTLKGTFVNTTPLPTYVALAGTKNDHATPEVSNAEAEAESAGTDSAGAKATKITPRSTNALVIVPDIFGFSLPNPKLLADILAEKCGIDVWAFDIFSGDPPILEDQLAPYYPEEPGKQPEISFGMKLKRIYLMATTIPKLVTKFRPGLQDTSTKDTVEHLRKEYKYEKIAMVGYCWGGGIVSRLAAIPGVADSVISVHPGGRYKDAVPRAVVPIAYLIAEEDESWDPKHWTDTEEAWKSRTDAPKYMYKIYPGTVHGFGARPNFTLPKVKAAWNELNDDISAWVKETCEGSVSQSRAVSRA